MNLVADTSVLVAAMVEPHPAHVRSLAWFNRALGRRGGLHICAHSLAELYAVLTRLPVRPRIAPGVARRLILENIEESAVEIVHLDATDYAQVLDVLSEGGFSGGSVYDALIVHAARKVEARHIITLNEADFVRLCPGGTPKITAP